MTTTNLIKPFIVWVGGKRRIAKKLASLIPTNLNNYYEPFLGGGALFFNVFDRFKKCYLSDINLELITSYNAVKNNPELVGKLLLEHEHNNSKEYFYQVRDNVHTNDPVKISARFLYLNRYSFRGIYRVDKNNNSKASFSNRNYKNNTFDNVIQTLSLCKDAMQNSTIYANDFSFITAKENDFVYFDPPYHKSGETLYTRISFSEYDQIRLRNFASKLTRYGVKLMISNSNNEFIRNLYSSKEFFLREIEVDYQIRTKNRNDTELVITNYNK